MLLGRVIGTVVPATQVDGLAATPFLWVQPLDRDGRPEGEPLARVRASGPRESRRAAREPLGRERASGSGDIIRVLGSSAAKKGPSDPRARLPVNGSPAARKAARGSSGASWEAGPGS